MKNSVESLLGHDHESLDQVLTQLDEELAKPNIPRAFELLDFFWARLAVHIRGENLHLFPAIESAPTSLFSGKGSFPTREEAQAVLARLRADHDFFMKELAQLMKKARVNGTGGAGDFRVRLTAIRKRLETHNQIEERQVYVWPSLLLDETTVASIEKRVRLELENMPPRFAAETQ